MSEMTGRCLCGETRFSFGGEPNWVLYCHCESCRRATSSPVTAWVSVPVAAFTLTHGVPTSYASSPGVRRTFCPTCGSPLSYETEDLPGEIHLYVASLDDPEQLRPTRHVFEEERLDWFDVHDNLPRYKTTSQGGKVKPSHFGAADR